MTKQTKNPTSPRGDVKSRSFGSVLDGIGFKQRGRSKLKPRIDRPLLRRKPATENSGQTVE